MLLEKILYESLAVGVPHLNNCKDSVEDINHKFFNSPMIHALTEDNIYKEFIDYEQNSLKYKYLKNISKTWFDSNLGIGLAKKYIVLFKLLITNKEFKKNDNLVRIIFEK